MPRELDQNDIDNLKLKLGYQTGPVAVDRDVIDALIIAWEDRNRMEDEDARREN